MAPRLAPDAVPCQGESSWLVRGAVVAAADVILAGDIGGTKTRLALFRQDADRLERVADETYASREHRTFEEVLARFRAAHGAPLARACLGAAGPVRQGRVRVTNLPWVLDERDLAARLGLARAWVINDLEAAAWSLALLPPEAFCVLQEGTPDPTGNAAIIAAGTGLGEAGLAWNGQRHEPFACEGGHVGFAPRDDREVRLLRWLRRRLERVSWERVVSGPGLADIYRFLRESEPDAEPAALTEALRGDDPAPAITRAAAAGVPLASAALDLFVGLYGARAGDLALTVMATAGLYVAGGIAPRILARLQGGTFLRAFTGKGRMRPLLEAIPVRVVLDDRAALLGAARCATVRAAGG